MGYYVTVVATYGRDMVTSFEGDTKDLPEWITKIDDTLNNVEVGLIIADLIRYGVAGTGFTRFEVR